ncbi:MAG: hypothetical protein Q9185_004627 [Variospora sp. 1 TL-2023]
MESKESRPLTEILDELEAILDLRKQLERNTQLQPLFSHQWFERTLSVRAQELESAMVSRQKIDGLENLSLLVKLHIELMQWDFHGLNDQITTAINLQKAHLDLDTARKEASDDHEPVSMPSMSGTFPVSAVRTFPIRAIASQQEKISSMQDDLYLIWDEAGEVYNCFKGRTNLTSVFSSLQVVANQVTEFSCSRGSTKVLIQYNADMGTKVPLFIDMVNDKAVHTLFDELLNISQNDMERHLEDSSNLDELVAGFEYMRSSNLE